MGWRANGKGKPEREERERREEEVDDDDDDDDDDEEEEEQEEERGGERRAFKTSSIARPIRSSTKREKNPHMDTAVPVFHWLIREFNLLVVLLLPLTILLIP